MEAILEAIDAGPIPIIVLMIGIIVLLIVIAKNR